MKEDEFRQIFELEMTWDYRNPISPALLREVGRDDTRRRTSQIAALSFATLSILVVVAVVTLSVGERREAGPSSVGEPSADTPLLTHPAGGSEFAAELAGEFIKLRNNCLYYAELPVLWPENARWNARDNAITFEQNDKQFVLMVGETKLSGVSGGIIPLRAASGSLNDTTKLRLQKCARESEDVVFIN